jgi:hypothetical protein
LLARARTGPFDASPSRQASRSKSVCGAKIEAFFRIDSGPEHSDLRAPAVGFHLHFDLQNVNS